VAEEARLEETESGLTPTSAGWFVVNVGDAAWMTQPTFGAYCRFEGTDARFPDIGINIHVLQPGQPNCYYHWETNEEHFLVLSGECMLIVDGEERPLRAWDFVHCPPGTEHVFVGAGDAPCAILMVGGRTREDGGAYPASEVALRYGAGVEQETASPEEAYAAQPRAEPGRPERWNALPWATRAPSRSA
jgi:uncharacterized cupin superfamily protein